MSLQTILEDVRTLSIDEQKQLLKVLVDIVTEPQSGSSNKTHSLRELRGLGKEIWEGIEPQEYINQQRDEWNK